MEEKLIALVQKHPVLFDSGHKDYYNVNLKEQIWEVIGGDLQVSGEVLKKRWNNLRDAHRKALLKRKTRTMLGKGRSRKLKAWKFEKHMSFINDHLAYSPQLQNNLGTVAGLKHNHDDEVLEEDRTNNLDISDRLSESDGSGGTESSTALTSTPINKIFQKHTGKKHKHTEATGSKSDTAALLEMYLANKEKRKVPQADDHLTAFFKSAEATVRTFTYTRQVHIKAEISALLTKYEMQNLLATERRNKEPS